MGILAALRPQKIVILRPLQFGDLMCTVPAWRALKAALPNAEITLVGLPWAAEFVERFSQYLDGFIEFPGFPGFPEREPQVNQFPSFLRRVQAQKFDLALQMQGSGNLSNSLVELFGAKETAGFFEPGAYRPDPSRYLLYPDNQHEIRRHLRLMEFLNVPLQGDELEFPVTAAERRKADALRDKLGLTGPYAILHPGARAPERRWAPEKFAILGDCLATAGLHVVLSGTTEEEEVVTAVSRQMTVQAANACGLTTSGMLAALMEDARLLVSNDTGVSHLAAALRVPSVILFSSSDPERWAPLDDKLHRRVLNAGPASPQEVWEEAAQLLAEERTYAI